MTELTGLPGHLRVERGLRDLSAGRESPEALLLRIAAPRLAALGLDVSPLADDANLALYARLRECAGPDEDAYAIYNEEGELSFVASCRKTYPGTPGPSFYGCIAPDMELVEAALRRNRLELRNGMKVRIFGYLDFWAQGGRLGLKMCAFGAEGG